MPLSKILARWMALASLACTPPAFCGINTWTTTGPDSGDVTAVEFHPTNPQIALAATAGGLYRTVDGGANWSPLNPALSSARNMSFDPKDPNRVFAAVANSELWVSGDAGATFTLGTAPEFGVRQVEFTSAGVVYLQTLSAHLWRSTDKGATWTACGYPWGADTASNAFTVDPNAGAADRLYMEVRRNGLPNGTWRSVDNCATWTMTGAGSPASGTDELVYNYSVMPTNPSRVLASTSAGVKLSTDGGDTWNVVYVPPFGTATPAWWVEYDPASPGKAVAMTEIAHIIRSADGGDTWEFAEALSAPYNVTLALDPKTSGRMFVGTVNGLYQSVDNGTTFTLRNKGMRAGHVYDFDVADDGTVYATFLPGAGGIFRRNPQTAAWGPVNNDALWHATVASRFQTSFVSTAPTNSSVLYAGNYDTNLMRSNDAGVSWQQTPVALWSAGAAPSDTAVDPDNAQIAYTATSNQGMWKTTDGGVNWTQINTGIPLGAKLVAAARGSDVVYAVSADPSTPYPGAIYKSLDGGAQWALTGPAPIAPGDGYFTALVIDPKNANVVYAPFYNGVYKTTNGGTSWSLMGFPGLANPQISGLSVSIDPDFSATLVVSRTPDWSAVARTVDGGAHWERIAIDESSSRPRYLTRALINPAKPSLIIAGAVVSDIVEYEVATDLVLGISGVATGLPLSATVSGTVTVQNAGPHAASPSRATITLPSWLTLTTPSGCTRSGQTLTCDVPALQVGDTHSIPLSFTVSAAGGTGSITASLATHETELVPANNSVTLSIVGSERADLGVALTPTSVTIDRGAGTNLTATVVNRGPNPSTATQLTLEIPTGMTVQTITPSVGSCVPSGSDFACTFGTMAVNASATVALQMTATTKGGHTVVARVDGAGIDTGTDQLATAEIGARAVGDVSVTLAESADPVTVGTPYSYTATLNNLSGDSANVQLQLGVGGTTAARIVSITPAGIACSFDSLNVHCTGLDFAAGGSATVTMNVESTTPGIVIAGATVSYGGTDTNADNNTASVGTTLRLVGDVSTEIAVSPAAVALSAPFTYTVTLRNAGPNAGAVNVAIPVTGASVSAATTTAGTCSVSTLPVTCNLTSIASGGSATIVITAFASLPGTASATATATFVGVDPVPSNNSATAQAQASAVADIGVTIAESADPVKAGSVLSYLVTLTTAGPSESNVRVTVPVTGGTVTGATPSQGGTCSIGGGSLVTCDFNPMSFSPSTVEILLNSTTAGTVTATATVSSSATDPVAANNTAAASTTINAAGSSGSSSGGGSSGGGGSSSSSGGSSGGGSSSSGGTGSGGGASGSSGGGGGGGGFDWLALGLLGVLLARRRISAPASAA